MTIIKIHNVDIITAGVLEKICKKLHLSYSYIDLISSLFDDLYNYEITLEEKDIVPFMISFFHSITVHEYEKIEIF